MITAKQAKDIVKSLDYYTLLDGLINNAINRAANLGKMNVLLFCLIPTMIMYTLYVRIY